MTARAIPIENNAQWHELRAQHVGGSEVAALFGESDHTTEFELWHRKKGLLPEPDLSDNDRVFWGQILEPAIADGAAIKAGWKYIEKVSDYYSYLPELGLGGSLDYKVVGQDRGPGVLEIKTADWLVAKRWENGEPPLSYMLQIQTYLALTGWDWGCMAVLVGGNDLRLFEYERRPKTIDLICTKVFEFWKSVESDIPPKPDFGQDSDAISRLYGSAEPGKVIDLSGSNRLPELIEKYSYASQKKRDGEAEARAAKAEIHALLGDAEMATCGKYLVKAGMVSGVPDWTITTDHVGSIIKGRAGYRGLWINLRKEEQ